jgi:hypothetical protein
MLKMEWPVSAAATSRGRLHAFGEEHVGAIQDPVNVEQSDHQQGVLRVSVEQHRGTGWIVISAILLALAGASIFINGLWALHANSAIQNSVRGTLLFSDTNLNTWGWLYVIVGAIVFVAGIAVFWRAYWAVILGVTAASLGAIVAFFWLFTPYWPDALLSIILNAVVIYGLGTYGMERATV